MKKVIAVFMAVVMAVSCLSVNAMAFEFDSSDRTRQEAFADWFKALQEFAKDPVNKADDMVKANHRFNVDMIALGYEDNLDIINGITSGFVPGYDKFNDEALNQLTHLLNKYGVETPKQQFEDWYQNKYGKDYYKHNLTPYPTSSQYYLFYERYEGEEKFRVFIESYDGTPLTVKEDENGKYFEGKELGKVAYKMYKKNIKNIKTGEWSEWFAINDDWSIGYVSQYKCYLDEIFVRNGCPMHIQTNLPLNYWGDIIGGDPVTDWSELGDDFVSEDIPEGLTPDEFNDFLSDLLNDLKDSMPDLSTVEGILQAIYRKCCSIDGKIGKQVTNVYKQTLQGIQICLDKVNAFCSSFWTDFSKSMQTLFIPEENYVSDKYDALIETFNNKFGFASDIKSEIDDCITLLDKPPVSTFSIHYKSIKLDLSLFDSYIDLIRYCIAIPIYFVFIVRIYRKTPWYMQGGGE